MPIKRKSGAGWEKPKKGRKGAKTAKTNQEQVGPSSVAPITQGPSSISSMSVDDSGERNQNQREVLFLSIVRGSRSQDSLRYGADSRNNQCTANAAIAVAYSLFITPFSVWSSGTIDNILDYGDELYRKSISVRTPQQPSEIYLYPIEIYPSITINNITLTLEILEADTVTGHIVSIFTDNIVDVPLHEGLLRIFQNFQSAIFTSNVKSISISKVSDLFYIFDSHSRSANGEQIETEGKACLLKFSTLELMTRFLLRCYNNTQLYTLVPIKVLRLPVDNRNLSNRTNNQNRHNVLQQAQALDYLGPMDNVCPNCRAMFFAHENFICCNKGDIVIPTNIAHPTLLEDLISGNHQLSRPFIRNVRRYNTLLAMASTILTERENIGTGAPVVVVSGQIYHKVADIDASNPAFGTLYFIDSGEATRTRIATRNSVNCDMGLLQEIDALLRVVNPYVKIYCSLGQIVKECQRAGSNNAVQEVGIYFHNQPGTDRKVNAAPTTSNEIGAVFRSVDGNLPPPATIRVQLIADSGRPTFQNLPRLSPIADALCYPLLFPHGELGWAPNLSSNSGKCISMRQFECYRLMARVGSLNYILCFGKLTQQFIVDAYVQVEGHRLYYIKTHQVILRVEQYVGLADYVAMVNARQGNEQRIGRPVILPSTFTGGTRFMIENYQDAMAIVAKFGKPSLFVTFTCNPNWKEIRENMNRDMLNPQDRPDLIARVFHMKLKNFFKDVEKKRIFGEVIAFVYVIEFQKRGLPHMHCLLFLADQDKLRNPDDVDRLISAELPMENTRLYDIVLATMVHGPCGIRNPNSPCMDDGHCTKKYPKPFVEVTSIDGALPMYRRRDDGRTAIFKRNNVVSTIDNRDIVPYNPYLLLKYECHINVEAVTAVGSVKYVFKYINKGHDAATVAIRDECEYDEIKAFIESRYVSSGEAAWRLLAFPIQGKSHTIYRLPVHLPGERVVYFEEGQEELALQRPKVSLLEAYFLLNASDSGARTITYTNIPLHYSFDKKANIWQKRVRNRKVIPRMYTISPKYVEKFHLRILLLHVPGAVSFEDLRIFDNVTYATFREAVQARGLIATDQEWVRTLRQAAISKMPGCMRKLFAYMLCYCEIRDPIQLWLTFKYFMCEDYLRRGHSEEQSENFALCRIDRTLRFLGRSLRDFNLPEPLLGNEGDDPEDTNVDSDPVNLDPNSLNPEQRVVFHRVISAVETTTTTAENLFFLQGNGGCGKTYIYNFIIQYCETHNIPCLSVAFTGIAALLLRNGRTVHSTFKLPLDVDENSRSSITAQSEEAQRLRTIKLIIWDEVTMASYHVVNAVDELLRDICMDQRPFGGKCILLGGDVKQLLPVASGQVRQVELFFTNCKSWHHFKVLNLITNMRVISTEINFMNWLADLGQGNKNMKIYNSPKDYVFLPKQCITSNVIHEIYGDLNSITAQQLATRAILCPRNDHCNYLNDKLIEEFPGNVIVSRSIDSVASGDEDEIANFPEEYLNTVVTSGLPLHELKLKVGIPIILLRNLCLEDGLINGTRLLVLAINDVLLTAEIITGRFAGRRTLIPKLDLTSSDKNLPFTLKRHQFPVKVCFALTINKAQGQTFDQVGIYLRSPVFSHGQLYVAFSRARSWDSVKVEVVHTKEQGYLMKSSKKLFTKNIVYRNVLDSIKSHD